MPADPAARRAIFDKNKVWQDADVRFPSWQEAAIEYTCVGGNHLLTFLKMVAQGKVCDSFCSVGTNGGLAKMSLEQLGNADADFASAVKCGVPCIVLKRGVRDEAGALEAIQASENAGAALQTLESDKQCVLRCAALLDDNTKEYHTAIATLEAQFPQLQGHIPDYFEFCEKLGGRASVHFQHWKIADARFGTNKIQLRGELLKAIAGMSVLYPLLKRALAWSAKQVPLEERKKSNIFSDWYAKSDIASLKQKPDLLIKVEHFLGSLEKHSRGMFPNDEKNRLVFFCRAEARACRFILEKKDKSFPVFDSLHAIRAEYDVELAEFVKSRKTAPRSAADKKGGLPMLVVCVCAWGKGGRFAFQVDVELARRR